MFHTRNIADELAGIRSEINALKAREQMLRDVVLSDPDSHAGQNHEVVVKKQKRRVLLRDRLPAHILRNPAYWEEREVPHVTLRERQASDVVDLSARRVFTSSPVDEVDCVPQRAVRPGDPVAERPKSPVLKLVAPEHEDSDVLEAFAD
ncbi:hypothetical protein [uncultured Roseovarius sp.]|uniref:hypothetical protein n=1 Tax=uncultured Roseovarius sp. TaxID=293344 RepID=UPI00261A18F7|nr:hypothetical protein [uncultured Roseovarius sp.]